MVNSVDGWGKADILEDGRAKSGKGAHLGQHGWVWVPVYCANCHCPWGEVPEASTHVAVLCNTCFATHGVPFGTYAVPDEVYWKHVNAEIEEQYGRVLAPEEIQSIADAGIGPLAKLLRDKPY
jgi:hypothetical protein